MDGGACASPWRRAFLSLRDETLNLNTTTTTSSSSSEHQLESLLENLIFSESDALISAAQLQQLPPHELTSDLIFLLQIYNPHHLNLNLNLFLSAFHLVRDVSSRVRLQINSSSWPIILDFLRNLVTKSSSSPQPQTLMQILDLLRSLLNHSGTPNSALLPQNSHPLLQLLLHILQLSITSSSFEKTNLPTWEHHIVAFGMIADTLTAIGSSLSPDTWQSALEVFKNVMDTVVSNTPLVEDRLMSRFYTSLLHCLHLLLSDPRGSLSEHVPGFVAVLRMFFVYGLTNHPPLIYPDTKSKDKELNLLSHKSRLTGSARSEHGAYRPPHLRKREGNCTSQSKTCDSHSFSDSEPYGLGFSSSDSEHSDSDGFGKDADHFRSSKARLAAIVCIQDLCQADLKAVTAHLALLLPTNNVLKPRKYEATLMTCLLFDPVLKTRMASASALASMLSGPSSVFLQVAEYKESTKCGSFTALSSSLGQILMQLHSGILHLVQHEVNSGFLALLFKVLMLLISATPYPRMPGELLTRVIFTLKSRMVGGFPSRTDQAGLTAMLLNCLGAAFSTTPPSLLVRELLREEIAADLAGAQGKQSLLSLLLQYSENSTNPSLSFESLQVLRAISHNYPSIMEACWVQVFTITFRLCRASTVGVPCSESSTSLLKGDLGNSAGFHGDRRIMASVKVLDECLRAISGFKGTEDAFDERSMTTPFTSDCTRAKRISSAPSYGLDGSEFSNESFAQRYSGSAQWCEAIENHLPLVLVHPSSMVRAASVTCFAGITSSVFFSLAKDKQDFILSSLISTALNDEVPTVRSAACRAIGVIACFPQISQRAEILDNFIHAIETNTRDPLVSVRITSSWALANLCDLLRHRASDFDLDMHSTDSKNYSRWISLMAECALRLSKDGDKIKSNAVRALGNLSRFVKFGNVSTSHHKECSEGSSLTTSCISHNAQTSRDVLCDPHWLGRMVQAFVSCVTTGNVKVRWNVCHALSNLFLNETMKLEDMSWAPSVFSILLLLLRDSSNFKIRIHAAAALAVPSSRPDYGNSFSDVVQGLEHVLETLGSDHISAPSSFKYREALENQLTASTLHVLSLVSISDPKPLKDFLVKKAVFLEEWLSSLNLSVEVKGKPCAEVASPESMRDGSFSLMQKKEMVQRTIRSLIDVYAFCNKHIIANRFEKLLEYLSN